MMQTTILAWPSLLYKYWRSAELGRYSSSYKALEVLIFIASVSLLPKTTMSDKCGNCDCADKSQCVKKGSSYVDVVETEKSYVETVVMDILAAEHDGKCKCGASCSCVNCTCGQ